MAIKAKPAAPSSPAPQPKSGSSHLSEFWLIFVLAGVQFVHIMDFVIIMPLGPALMRVLSLSPQQFGLAVSSYTFAASICGFVSAFFIDRFDRKTSLVVLCAGLTVGTAICGVARSYEILLLGRMVAGAFGGIMTATVFSIIGDLIAETRRGTATGTVMSAFSLASIAGVPLGLYLANQFGWHSPFLLLTALSLIITFAAIRILPQMRLHLVDAQSVPPRDVLKMVFYNRNQLTAFALIVALMFAAFSVIPYISPYLVANVGLTEADLPTVYLVGGACTLLTSRWIGTLADRYGKPQIFTWVAIFSILPVLLMTHLKVVPVAVAVLVTTAFTIMTTARAVPAMSMITSSVATRIRGSFMTFVSSIQQAAAGLASWFAGLMIAEGTDGRLLRYDWVGYVAVAFTLLAILLARRLKGAAD